MADKAAEARVEAAPAGSLKLLGGILFGSAPMILVQICTYLVILLTTQRLGHHSPEWLAGASLGGA